MDRSEYLKKYYQDNKEKHSLFMKLWRKNNKGFWKKHYDNNKEKENARTRKYYFDNIDKFREYHKKYREEHLEYRAYKQLERRARKLEAEGSHTLGEWELLKKQYGYRCPCCNKLEPFDGKFKSLTEDHIIPLSKGGSDLIENIQPLCQRCNASKHTKIIKYKNI
jgi:5-methylcytosine-specific restriction endonuclease McrA